jgi:glycine betaine/proline transport system substrate-binding protein
MISLDSIARCPAAVADIARPQLIPAAFRIEKPQPGHTGVETMKHSPSLLLAAMLSLPVITHAAEPEQCSTVNFSDVGWTDITVTTAVTSEILKGLGYKTRTTMISVPVTYKSLADGKNMDVFLGNWMPTMENDIKAYRDAGTVETVRANLENAKYTLAVPKRSTTRA